MKKLWIILIVVVVLIGLAIGLGAVFGTGAEVEPTAVRMEEVTRGELTEFVSAPGEIQAKSKVSISAKTAAQVIELPFEEGATVKQIDPIFSDQGSGHFVACHLYPGSGADQAQAPATATATA